MACNCPLEIDELPDMIRRCRIGPSSGIECSRIASQADRCCIAQALVHADQICALREDEVCIPQCTLREYVVCIPQCMLRWLATGCFAACRGDIVGRQMHRRQVFADSRILDRRPCLGGHNIQAAVSGMDGLFIHHALRNIDARVPVPSKM